MVGRWMRWHRKNTGHTAVRVAANGAGPSPAGAHRVLLLGQWAPAGAQAAAGAQIKEAHEQAALRPAEGAAAGMRVSAGRLCRRGSHCSTPSGCQGRCHNGMPSHLAGHHQRPSHQAATHVQPLAGRDAAAGRQQRGRTGTALAAGAAAARQHALHAQAAATYASMSRVGSSAGAGQQATHRPYDASRGTSRSSSCAGSSTDGTMAGCSVHRRTSLSGSATSTPLCAQQARTRSAGARGTCDRAHTQPMQPAVRAAHGRHHTGAGSRGTHAGVGSPSGWWRRRRCATGRAGRSPAACASARRARRAAGAAPSARARPTP